jgi:hypothetical protein
VNEDFLDLLRRLLETALNNIWSTNFTSARISDRSCSKMVGVG